MKNTSIAHSFIFGLVVIALTIITSTTTHAASIAERISGRIVLDVHTHGEAWYIYPVTKKRYYLGRASDAYQIMRFLSLGITNNDLEKIPTSEESKAGDIALRKRLSGMILLQVEEHGEAWYVYPNDLKRYYLGTADDAYKIMNELGLGISPQDLATITVAEDALITPDQYEASQVLVDSPQVSEPNDTSVDISSNCDEAYAQSYFYRDTSKNAIKHEERLRDVGNYEDAKTLRAISCFPQAIWITGGSISEQVDKVRTHVIAAEAERKIPVFVVYNIPAHYTLEWSSGLNNDGEYESWIEEIAKAIGTYTAWIIYEPDSINLSFDYSPNDRAIRHAQLKDAVMSFTTHSPNARLYMDGGHSSWRPVERVAEYLTASGVAFADGFFTNVSNFRLTSDEQEYAEELSNLLDGKHYVIDTSRNGMGPDENHEWCNPPGRAIGVTPKVDTGVALLDAYLWIKSPGESDGWCNGGPAPGKFWLEYALELVHNQK